MLDSSNSSKMSLMFSASLAPCLIKAWQPRCIGELMEPGTAKTSLPCSAASRAVINEPLLMVASTTKQAREIPLIRRFRRGKFFAKGGAPNGNSLIMTPPAIISRPNGGFLWGISGQCRCQSRRWCRRSFATPDMRGGIYALSHSACHAKAGFGKRARKNFGVFAPPGEALRLPTMEIMLLFKNAVSPCAKSKSGASDNSNSKDGY